MPIKRFTTLVQSIRSEAQDVIAADQCADQINSSWYLYSWGIVFTQASGLSFLFFHFILPKLTPLIFLCLSWNRASWGKAKGGVPLADFQAASSAESIHLRSVLQEKSNQQRYIEFPFIIIFFLFLHSHIYFIIFTLFHFCLWHLI